MAAMEYAELADAESAVIFETKYEEEYYLVRNKYDECT
jgi:hypothetical protein